MYLCIRNLCIPVKNKGFDKKITDCKSKFYLVSKNLGLDNNIQEIKIASTYIL